MSNSRDTKVDPEFAKIPKDSTGFYIWRVEHLELVPVPRKNYGDFYGGDAYIVFSATNQGEHGGTRLKPSKFVRHPDMRVHFWLGEACSLDEQAVAAFKTVELDNMFDDMPTQHREVQGFESLRFGSYFPDGIRYLKGGVKTGLKVSDDGFRPRLFIVKGEKSTAIREMQEISWGEMNDGDAFVLDAGERIYIYIGKNANRREQFEATTLATLFKDQPGEKIVRVDDGEEVEQLTGENLTIFEKYLPLAKKKLKKHVEFRDDSWVDANAKKLVRLFRCSDASGKLEIVQVKKETLEKTDLNTNDSFIVDAGRGNAGLWVWVGKKATEKERTESMKYAHEFLKREKYSEKTPIVRVIDGAEPIEFKGLFSGQWGR